jgi:peptidoglycan/xylan/chitin deacetylase (PgdA/CDA1 family)
VVVAVLATVALLGAGLVAIGPDALGPARRTSAVRPLAGGPATPGRARSTAPAGSPGAATPGGPTDAPTARTGDPGGTADPGGLPPAVLARLPQFAPAPPPQPFTAPAGPVAGWYHRVPTTQPVAFVTIDDGWVKRPEAVALVTRAHVPVTLFLTIDAIRDDPGYFRRLRAAGAVVEAHTLTHPSLAGMPYAAQRREICGSADQLARWYGRRPVLFRPPFGNSDATTLRAVRDCGMRAAFHWTETVDKGKVRYQRGHVVQRGDVILMHFRPAFVDDFLAALTAIHQAGLTPALLEDYVR